MKNLAFRIKLTTITLPAVALLATAADARHQWKKYEWAYAGGELSMPVVDNTSGDWPARVAKAVDDWNKSLRIESPYQRDTQNGPQNPGCEMTLGEIHACNDDYGPNGWLGIATISLNGNEIIAGTTKLNDHYFASAPYNTESWKQAVTCQEIGHDYGLAHQNENFMTDWTTSCMEYTSWPEGNETPDRHDYEQLELIYAVGGDSGGGPPAGRGGGKKLGFSIGGTGSDWGRAIGFLPNGKPNVFERNINGYRVVTHVLWTIEEASQQGTPTPRHHH